LDKAELFHFKISNLKENLRTIFLFPIVKFFAKLNVNPNFLTTITLILNLIPFYFYLSKNFLLGAISLILINLFDAMDGELARITNKTSKLGAFLDSNFDRISEALIFLSLIIAFKENFLIQILLIICAFGSFLISYIRARGESLGVLIKAGPMERAERIFFVALMTIFIKFIFFFLVIFSILIYITIIRRIYEGYKKMKLSNF